MNKLTPFLLVCVLLFVSSPATAEQLVREFSGSRTMQTATFEVKGPWLIDWLVNSDYDDSMGFAIVLLNEPSQTHVGTVVKTKHRGDGLRLMNESGRFSLRVDAVLANWTIKIIQLTPEEVELYTPKEKGLL